MQTEAMFDNMLITFQKMDIDNASKASANANMESMKLIINKLMNEDMVELYNKYFSEKEINDMINFYKSETGQKMLSTSPIIMNDVMELFKTKYMPEIMNKMNVKHAH